MDGSKKEDQHNIDGGAGDSSEAIAEEEDSSSIVSNALAMEAVESSLPLTSLKQRSTHHEVSKVSIVNKPRREKYSKGQSY